MSVTLSIEMATLTPQCAFSRILLGFDQRMRKTETLNLRVSAKFKRRLSEEAKKEKRSVTNYLETTLERLWRESRTNIQTRDKKD
jgi:hypothetical protein